MATPPNPNISAGALITSRSAGPRRSDGGERENPHVPNEQSARACTCMRACGAGYTSSNKSLVQPQKLHAHVQGRKERYGCKHSTTARDAWGAWGEEGARRTS